MNSETIHVESITSAKLADILECSELFIRSRIAKPTSKKTVFSKIKGALVCNALPQVTGEHHKNLKKLLRTVVLPAGVSKIIIVDDHKLTVIGNAEVPVTLAELIEWYEEFKPIPSQRVPMTKDVLRKLT